MTSKLNVIINPVRRWYSTDKPRVSPALKEETVMYIAKDLEGNPCMVFFGWANMIHEYAFYDGNKP